MARRSSESLNHYRPTKNPRRRLIPSSGRILVAAFEEFAANGYAGARLDGVARRANVAKGTIYLYFPSKSRLFQAVVRSLIRPVPNNLDLLLANSTESSAQLLAKFTGRQYTHLVSNRKARAIIRMLIAESGKFPQLSEVYRREVIAPGMNALRRLLERGIASGEFRDSRALAYPQLLAAPAILAVVWILIFGSRANLDLESYRVAHVEFVLSALGAARTSQSTGESNPATPKERE